MVLSILILASLNGCVTKQEINAALFVHEQIPETFCKQIPELNKLGVFRIFKCNAAYVEAGICSPGQEMVRERMSYCKPGIKTHFSVKDDELREILKKAGIK